MSETRYTEDHEWVRAESDGSLTVGITDYAQEQLGDIVFVQLPEAGARFAPGDEVVVIESVKAAADIKMPLAGEILAVNDALDDAPETVNGDPTGAGWFFKMKADAGDAFAGLLDQSAYDALVGR